MTDREIKIGDYIKTKNGVGKAKVFAGAFIGVEEEVARRTKLYSRWEVEPISRKDAFLSRLGALLREFDAEIVAHIGENNKTHQDIPLMYMQVGDDIIHYQRGINLCDITADNIMDFEKE